MRFGDLGAPELILCVLALVLVFGASKLGDLGGALGKSVREFKRAQQGDDAGADEATVAASASHVAADARPAVAEYRPQNGNRDIVQPAAGAASRLGEGS